GQGGPAFSRKDTRRSGVLGLRQLENPNLLKILLELRKPAEAPVPGRDLRSIADDGDGRVAGDIGEHQPSNEEAGRTILDSSSSSYRNYHPRERQMNNRPRQVTRVCGL